MVGLRKEMEAKLKMPLNNYDALLLALLQCQPRGASRRSDIVRLGDIFQYRNRENATSSGRMFIGE
jgi:hypothetical protein